MSQGTTILGLIEGGNKVAMFHFDLNKKPLLEMMVCCYPVLASNLCYITLYMKATDCGGHQWMGHWKMDPDAEKLSFFPVRTKSSTSKDATLVSTNTSIWFMTGRP